jgi:hypothetical protein
MNLSSKLLIFIIFSSFIISCSSKIDPVTGEKVIIEPNAEKRAIAERDKAGGIFGDLGNKKKESTNFEFTTSNVLWRATLTTLDFLPLSNVDYSGGIIVYDWYSEKQDSNEQIKISIRFLSNELRSDSIQITAHKKICNNNEKCFTKKLENNFSISIKDTIISTARNLRIEEEKKKRTN